jgi:putative ABC transport system substrate-binding protein
MAAPDAGGPTNLRRIGFLAVAGTTFGTAGIDAFIAGMRDYGWVEGQNIAIEWRFPTDAVEFPALAAELVGLPLDVVIGEGSGGALALMNATTSVPVVFMASTDPVAQGLITGLAQPGGNVTGVSQGLVGLMGERLELLKELLPSMSRMAVLWYPDQSFNQKLQQDFRAAAPRLGIHLLEVPVRAPEEMDTALETIASAGAQAMWIGADSLFRNQWTKIIDFAARHHLATLYTGRDGVAAGALMAYGPDNVKQHRQSVFYVDRILRGARPADLPVQFASEFELAVNVRTAQTLGLTIRPEFASRVTEWIQ